jgi:hypothetical protein
MAEASEKNTNYTPEILEKIKVMYEELGNDGLENIALAFDKTPRSIRSKLVREGIYIAAPKGAALKTEGSSKKEILRDIEALGFETEGFEGATKIALSRLLGLIAN